MLPTWKTLILRNLLLIAAIESIGLPKAGCALFDLDISKQLLQMIFDKFDLDGDGFGSRKEIISAGEKFADLENFDPSQKAAVVQSFSDLYNFYISASGSKDDVPLTADLLSDSIQKQKDNPEFRKSVDAMVHSLVTPMKLQEAGYLNYNEFNRAFENFGLFNVVFTKADFTLVDANHDGKVSVAELTDARVSVFTTINKLATAVFGFLG